MIPIPKPKFFERKVPAGQSEDDFFDEITARQTHILRDAVDRVSLDNFSVRRFENFEIRGGKPLITLTHSVLANKNRGF